MFFFPCKLIIFMMSGKSNRHASSNREVDHPPLNILNEIIVICLQ